MPQNSPHPFYTRHRAKWQRNEDAYAGEDAVKAGGSTYLPIPSGMKASMYNAYKLRADWFSGVERTLEGLAGLVFRRDPQIVGASERLQEQVMAQKPAIVQAVKQRLLTGQCGLFLNYVGDNLPVNELAVRWQAYPALAILNWQYADSGELVRVILVETVVVRDPDDEYLVKEELRYHELALTVQGFQSILWQGLGSRGESFTLAADPVVPLRIGQPFPFLPFAFLQAGDRPPLQGLVDKNYDYYRVSADYQHDLHFTSMQTPVLVGWDKKSFPDGEIALGPDALVSSNPDAKAFMLSPSAAGIEAKREKLQDTLTQMSILGSRILEPPRRDVEATATVQIRQSGEHASLGVMMAEMDTVCTRALRWHAWMLGETQDPNDTAYSFTFNKDYFLGSTTGQELTALVQAWQGGALTLEGLHYNLRQGEALPQDEQNFDTYQERLSIQSTAQGI